MKAEKNINMSDYSQMEITPIFSNKKYVYSQAYKAFFPKSMGIVYKKRTASLERKSCLRKPEVLPLEAP